MRHFTISVDYDKVSGVFFGTSENIPGLALEAATIAELLEVAMDIVPQLIESHFNPLAGDAFEIGITVRRPDSVERQGPQTKYWIDEAPRLTATA